MRAQRLLQVLTASLHHIQRGQQPQPGPANREHRGRAGVCLSCGEAVAAHWDAGNRFVGCLHARIVARRARRALRETGIETSGERTRA